MLYFWMRYFYHIVLYWSHVAWVSQSVLINASKSAAAYQCAGWVWLGLFVLQVFRSITFLSPNLPARNFAIASCSISSLVTVHNRKLAKLLFRRPPTWNSTSRPNCKKYPFIVYPVYYVWLESKHCTPWAIIIVLIIVSNWSIMIYQKDKLTM